MAFKGVCDCEILISEMERRLALCDCSQKEYSDKGLKERLWGEVCEGKDGNAGHYEESQKYGVFSHSMLSVLPQRLLYHRHYYKLQYQNTSTVSDIPNKRIVNSPTVSDALSNQSSDFLDIC